MRKRLNLQLFAAPVISQFDAYRSDASGNATDGGTRVTIIYEYSCDSDSATMELKYKNVNESDYNNTIMSETGASGNGIITPDMTFPIEEGYDFQISVSDGSYISNRTVTLSTAMFPFSIYKTGRGVAFGKDADTDELMDVQYAARFFNDVTINNDLSRSSHATIYLINAGDEGHTAIHCVSYSGNEIFTGIGAGGINRGIYDQTADRWMTYVDGNNDFRICYPGGNYRPYYAAGDTLDGQVQTAGYVTGDAADVTFMVPTRLPIVGGPNIRISGTLVLRQGNAYTHGSAGGSGVSPSSWEITNTSFGLRVVATMSSTANATNNSPIGIQAAITITLS